MMDDYDGKQREVISILLELGNKYQDDSKVTDALAFAIIAIVGCDEETFALAVELIGTTFTELSEGKEHD